MCLEPLRIVRRHSNDYVKTIRLSVRRCLSLIAVFLIIRNVHLSSCIKDCVAYKYVFKTMT